mmetsp:Transcript_13606/g.16354  ORF Transcript_13606/g.16354 Transcript_13606/m.16354 type:complete len:292 (-) Transcript_13606:315-1190(-)|eukprot:CAMPEP_0197847150 /NCGR_PEP_ID=MMETSP1438-20131217/5322_1 /TAXON_ID=1461541 /ORGANISM="Pterosperma sp., Strain CCMP1384" /LENGTH=291 /DNA_ID=CAMNT_0043458993 /DNA_START=129 /DNA_END=1004 /DNA_ORIENTATION=+
MSGPDALFNVHNSFYLGAYQQAINEASDVDCESDQERTDRDCFVYRAYIAMGSYQLVISEISEDAPTALQAVKLYAQYLDDSDKKESVLATIQDWLNDPACSSNQTLLVIAATIYAAEGNYNEALKICHNGNSLELMAFMVQLLLRMDRSDQAEKHLKAMSQIDDDATCTQLATAWTNLALGGSKVQEAFYVFQELGDKYSWTVKLHNGSAVCSLAMGNHEEAEKELLEALNKDNKDPDTLANLVVSQLHLGKPTARYLNQLKMVAPEHMFVKKNEQMEDLFDKAAEGFSA